MHGAAKAPAWQVSDPLLVVPCFFSRCLLLFSSFNGAVKFKFRAGEARKLRRALHAMCRVLPTTTIAPGIHTV